MKNIVILVALLSLIDELPELPEYARANRRAARKRAIAHNKKIYHDRCGRGHWSENRHGDGFYHSYHSGHVHSNNQDGRWEDFHINGHRRFQKWSRDYYPSDKDEFARLRWEDELKDYFDK